MKAPFIVACLNWIKPMLREKQLAAEMYEHPDIITYIDAWFSSLGAIILPLSPTPTRPYRRAGTFTYDMVTITAQRPVSQSTPIQPRPTWRIYTSIGKRG